MRDESIQAAETSWMQDRPTAEMQADARNETKTKCKPMQEMKTCRCSVPDKHALGRSESVPKWKPKRKWKQRDKTKFSRVFGRWG